MMGSTEVVGEAPQPPLPSAAVFLPSSPLDIVRKDDVRRLSSDDSFVKQCQKSDDAKGKIAETSIGLHPSDDESGPLIREVIPEVTESVAKPLRRTSVVNMKLWASSLIKLDPRQQILDFFNEVALMGDGIEKKNHDDDDNVSDISQRSSVFTVWRPTSLDAIRKMMNGEGTGKGLDIKGKSAKKGMLSGYIPFIQIYEDTDKSRIRTLPKDGRLRVFYDTKKKRDDAAQYIKSVSSDMVSAVIWSKDVLARDKAGEDIDDDTLEKAMGLITWVMNDPCVTLIDKYARQGCFGIELAERLFLESYVMRQDCTRPADSKYFTGRPSEPMFQDMNFTSVRKRPLADQDNQDDGSSNDKAIAVVWQCPEADHAMCPRTLVVAYEESGRKIPVAPVVSDFDCFIMGTQGFAYVDPLAPEQLDVMRWCISQTKAVLDSSISTKSWTQRWLEVLKESAAKGFYPHMPEFGYSDPKSYLIMENAVASLKESGAVRHGPECFNYYFPQELDDHFLVISDTMANDGSGSVPWKYVDERELQSILCQKIDEGFTFPLNPKWVLCDPGWKKVFDKLVECRTPTVQQSMACWYPPGSGLREMIEEIHQQHPNGFQREKVALSSEEGGFSENDGTSAMDIAELQLKNFLTLQRAKRKLRVIFALRSLMSK